MKSDSAASAGGLAETSNCILVHRDLKAANMLMSPCSDTPGMLQVKLADFRTAISLQKPGDGKDPQQHLCLQPQRNYTTLYLELCIGKQWLELPEQPEVATRVYEECKPCPA